MRGLALCMVSLMGCAGWTKSDVALETTFVATAAVDWHQSTGIVDDCRELNPVIGSCGDVVPLSVYFPVLVALHVVIAAALPRRWRGIFQGVTIGIEATTIYRNEHTRS
jgi:hypothetical protein